MALLLIDNSNHILRIALSSGPLYNEYQVFDKKHKSDFIISDISNLIKESELNSSDISEIGYVNSGLSFTGIRVGLSVAMAISIANNAKLFSLDPFECLIIQYCRDYKNSFKNHKYLVVIAPSYGNRTNIAIVKQNLNNFTMITKHNICLTEESKIELPIEYESKDAITILNTLPDKSYKLFEHNCNFKYKENDIAKNIIYANNFELKTINDFIISGYFSPTNLLYADVNY